jgi:probable F420-dependent oxidoreductase
VGVSGFEFGVNVHAVESREAFAQFVRRADELGCDVLALPDHLGVPAPFSTLAAAGAISPRLRLRTYVLNVGFWNPALLAREVATLDVLSGGRAAIGLGAGHMRSEHDDAGLPWRPPSERIALLEETLLELRRRLAADDHRPRPVQQPVPVMVGAMSERGLRVAARHADVVCFAGLRQVAGAPPGTFTVASADETAMRVEQVGCEAGARPYRSDVLLQRIVLGREPRAAAEEMAASAPSLSAEQLLDSPFVLLARDAAQAADVLLERHEVYGFDSFTTHQPFLEALGEVIAVLSPRG